MKKLGIIAVAVLLSAVAATEDSDTDGACGEEDGFFADAVQCDKYYECKEGERTEHTCKDGLVFDASNKKWAVCSFPFSIDCAGREELQEANPTENCPRQNGYFPHPDPKVCDKFFQCVDGAANPITCPTSLVFDLNRGQCAYEEQAKREGCSTNSDNFEELYDFRCPPGGSPAVHPRFPDPKDCQYFYICIGGRDPQRSGCPVGLVFNPDKKACDHPDNVAGECRTWYNETFLEEVGGLDEQGAAEVGVSLDRKIDRRKQSIQREEGNPKPSKAAEKVQVVFSCPPSNNPHLHPRFPDPNDCQYFYICIGGTEPRRNGCTEGLVYNPDKKACDLPENVTGECRAWYDEGIQVSPEHAAEAGVSLDQKPDQSGTPADAENGTKDQTPEEASKAPTERVRINRVRTRVRGRTPQRPVAGGEK